MHVVTCHCQEESILPVTPQGQDRWELCGALLPVSPPIADCVPFHDDKP